MAKKALPFWALRPRDALGRFCAVKKLHKLHKLGQAHKVKKKQPLKKAGTKGKVKKKAYASGPKRQITAAKSSASKFSKLAATQKAEAPHALGKVAPAGLLGSKSAASRPILPVQTRGRGRSPERVPSLPPSTPAVSSRRQPRGAEDIDGTARGEAQKAVLAPLSSKASSSSSSRQGFTLRIYGDSNAVGYRAGSEGTKKYMERVFAKTFNVKPTLGRTRLTILQSSFAFLPWAIHNDRKVTEEAAAADFTVLVLGTNDITYLRKNEMSWSVDCGDAELAKQVRLHLRKILKWVGARTRRKLFVIEPINAMPQKAEQRKLVIRAMHDEVEAQSAMVNWVQMAWSAKDLQRSGRSADPRHFNRAGVRRLVEAVVGHVRNV